MFASIKKDPTSFKEALNSENKNKWEMATRQKLDSMNDNNEWEIVNRSLDKREEDSLNKVDSRWVFTRKTGNEKEELFKARLVIRGSKDKNIYE